MLNSMSAAVPKKRGRPSKYTPEIAAEICERLANGELLNAICAEESTPSLTAVMEWVRDDREGFAQMYARAREVQIERMSHEIITISDDGSGDYVTRTREDGSEYEAVDQEHIQRSKLRVDARKWLLSKLKPEKYGDRVSQDVQLTGAGGGPVQVFVQGVEPGPK